MTDSLEIICTSEVETNRLNPFDYIIDSDRAGRLPMEYSKPLKTTLEPYRIPSSGFGDEFDGFVARIMLESSNDSLKFLSILNTFINENFKHELREEGPAQEPEETISRKRGSCRDFCCLI